MEKFFGREGKRIPGWRDSLGEKDCMITVLFENDHVLAIDKPEGISSIPERRASRPCLLDIMSRQFPEKLFVVHRLDKEVSGVMIFARNAAAHRFLNAAFEHRRVEKTYRALVHGTIEKDCFVIDAKVRPFGSGRMGVDAERGLYSSTEVRVLHRGTSATLIEAHPITGRRHQIRVHLYSIAHPVVGDLRYGQRSRQKLFGRLMLHSYKISFDLPTGERLSVEAPLPESFTRIETVLLCRDV
ncbi:MAG: RluA family pseudouridine synthase [Desulfomonilia bacterium]|nr:RluA family pseudouridine synthase [Desulfomonilia bacterium]